MRWLLVIILLIPSLAAAKEARPLADNPQVEARLKHLAVDREIREMIAKNMSDRDIIDFLVARYGDFVLYRPPLKPTTTLLWVGPFLSLIAGATALVLVLRKRQRKLADVSLSEEERNRVAQLLAEGAKRL